MMNLVKRTSARVRFSGLACILFLAFWATPLNAAYQITALECTEIQGGAMVTIRTTGRIGQNAFTIGAPEPRLVLDLSNTVHALPKYRYEQLGTDVITRIRTSQYRPYPQPVVRLVLDLPELVSYTVESQADKLVIKLQEGVAPITRGTEAPPEPGASPSLPSGPSKSTPDDDQADVAGSALAQEVPTPAAEEKPLPKSEKPTPQEREAPETRSRPEVPPGASESISPVSGPEEVVPEQPIQPKSELIQRLLALGIREPVSYSGGGRRDPFVALPTGQEVEFGQTPLPDVERLSIVGILMGVDGYRALVQDDQNHGYVLRKGDRVLYGYVVRVEAERIVFRLNRRGLDRTIILKLPQ
jgi:hypothetical protein